MQYLRHLLLPVKNLLGFAHQNMVRWIAPIIVVALAMAAAMIVGHVAAPF